MASFDFSAGNVFQDGTSVGAYPASQWPAHVTSPEGAPRGAATNSQTMSGGAATFTGLAENARYYAGAEVSGTWRYVGFTVGQDIDPHQDNAKRSADETITGAWTFGVGEDETFHTAIDNAGRRAHILDGSLTVPTQIDRPTLKVSRIQDLRLATAQANDTSGAGTMVDHVGAIYAHIENVATNELTTTALMASAISRATSGASASSNDAQGGVFKARAEAGVGDGDAIGLVSVAQQYEPSGKLTGFELNAHNEGGAAHTYSASTGSRGKGMVIRAGGSADVGAGLQFSNPNSRKFLVGIGFLSQNTGPVLDSTIRDDGTAATSLDIRGTHATAAISVDSGSGPVLIGTRTVTSAAELLEIVPPDANTDPVVRIGRGVARTYTLKIYNSTGVHGATLGVVGTAGNLMTGTATGDASLYCSGNKIVHLGRISSTADIKVGGGVGFYGTAPIAKQTGVAVSAAGVHAALVNLGLIAA